MVSTPDLRAGTEGHHAPSWARFPLPGIVDTLRFGSRPVALVASRRMSGLPSRSTGVCVDCTNFVPEDANRVRRVTTAFAIGDPIRERMRPGSPSAILGDDAGSALRG